MTHIISSKIEASASDQGAGFSLEDQFRPLEGYDKNQPGYEHRKGWNDAIRHVMALQAALATPADTAAVGEDLTGHKWLDPECGVRGCQSLVWKDLYEKAVHGRAEFRQAYREARVATQAPVSGEPDFASDIARVVKEETEGGAVCGWKACSGCHETNDGYETGHYPHSKMFGCYVGSGCQECGGLGVVWEHWSEGSLAAMQAAASPVSEPQPSGVVVALTDAYEKVKLWPETRPDGIQDLLALRNLVPEAIRALSTLNPVEDQPSYQEKVDPWLIACFGEEIARDKIERSHRFLEEALELVQAVGCTASEAYQVVDYVFGRPVGETHQEVGGVMVTLAALCLANGLDMHEAGETELARVWTKVEKIRAKHFAKPKFSPLPGSVE